MNSTLILHLSLIKGVGPSIVHPIIEKISEDSKDIHLYTMSASDVMHSFSLTPKQAERITIGLRDRSALEKELTLIEKHGIRWASYLDSDYPALLRHMHRPPLIVYWQGSAVWHDRQGVAFVGSRKATMYARHFLHATIPELIRHGMYTVSGGALGADTMAHRVTIDAAGKTIAVLGSGLLCPYPTSNKKLFKEIASSGGAVISTFPLMTQPKAGNFPARNYIISGLSAACVVVQAAQKSGALITAYAALDQGREVCAVPGLFNDPLSVGCHHLIAQGAHLVSNADDIIACLGDVPKYPEQKQKMDVYSVNQHPVSVDNSLSTQEQSVVASCSQPANIDEIIQQTGLEYAQVSALLFDLSLDGHVEQEASGLWKQV